MSAFLIVTFSKENADWSHLLEDLNSLSHKMSFGLFIQNRFIEPFEYEYKPCFSFSISDSYEFNNCDLLIRPWWYTNSSKSYFIGNMKKIKSVIDLCLLHTDTVDIWFGTSGDTIIDFEHYNIVANDFISNISARYEQNDKLPPPPSIHYHIVK